MTQTETNDDSAEIDKLLAEIEHDALPEVSDKSKLNKNDKKTIEEFEEKELNYENTIQEDEDIERTVENTW